MGLVGVVTVKRKKEVLLFVLGRSALGIRPGVRNKSVGRKRCAV